MKRLLLAIILSPISSSVLIAQTLSVGQLAQIVANPSHLSDQELARRISKLELSECLTEDRLTTLQNLAPGPKTSAILEDLMQQSSFLEPPPVDIAAKPPPTLSEQKAIYGRSVDYLLQFARRLPNLIATETIRRFDDDASTPENAGQLGRLRPLDTAVAQVTYSNGLETLEIKTVNGLPDWSSRLSGVNTNGEFSNILVALAMPASRTEVHWNHWETLQGKEQAVFRYSISSPHSQYSLALECEGQAAHSVTIAYSGFVFVNPTTGAILRITRSAENIPAGFPIHQVDTAVDYAPVTIAGTSYLLPVRSVTASDNPLSCKTPNKPKRVHALNDTRFLNYHLFATNSQLLTSSETIPESAIPSQPSLNTAPPLPTEAPEIADSLPATPSALALPSPPPPFAEPPRPIDASFSSNVTFRTHVDVVTVPTVVRDKAGKFVHGLTKEDFELLDNGKQQTIFDVVEERTPNQTPGIAATNRFVAFLFDDVHLPSQNLSQVRSAAERVTAGLLKPGVLLAILTTSGKVHSPFTNDPAKIHAALYAIQSSPAAPLHSDCPEISFYVADQIVNRNDSSALQQKAGEAVENRGVPPVMAASTALNAARRSLALHNRETGASFNSVRATVEALSVLPGERALVLISAGIYTPAALPGLQQIVDHAARAGLVINAFDARGLYTSAGFDSTDPNALSTTNLRLQETEQLTASDGLAQLADATARKLFRNSNDFDSALSQLAAPPEAVYILTFAPPTATNSVEFHKLKVMVKSNRSYQIQARRGYLTNTPPQDLQNALSTRNEMHDIGLAVTPTFTPNERKLSLLLHIDANSIRFEHAGAVNRDTLSFVIAFFDAGGTLIARAKEELPLNWSDSELAARRSSGIAIKSTFDVKPGPRFMRLALRNSAGQMSTFNYTLAE